MNRKAALPLLIALAVSRSFAADPVIAVDPSVGANRSIAADPATNWMPFPDDRLTVNGLPWFAENGRQLLRLPAQFKDTYPRSVWRLAQDPTGARIRFRTDSTELGLRLEYPHAPGMRNMSAIGQSGVDLYVGRTYWGNMSAFNDWHPGKIYEEIFFNFPDEPRTQREITLYLPLYEEVKVVAVGLDPHAQVKPPRPYSLAKPIVFYGTSITQSGCVSRPGMGFDAIIGRRLNADFVNLGFSGSGKYEAALAQQVAKIDASCFVLDGSNIAEAADNAKVFGPFVDIIRAQHPQTPIVVVSPLYSTQELTMPTRKRQQAERRVFTRKFVSDRIGAGDGNIYLVDGTDLIGPSQGSGLVDGSHLNDLGSQWYADAMTRRLASILGLGYEAQ